MSDYQPLLHYYIVIIIIIIAFGGLLAIITMPSNHPHHHHINCHISSTILTSLHHIRYCGPWRPKKRKPSCFTQLMHPCSRHDQIWASQHFSLSRFGFMDFPTEDDDTDETERNVLTANPIQSFLKLFSPLAMSIFEIGFVHEDMRIRWYDDMMIWWHDDMIIRWYDVRNYFHSSCQCLKRGYWRQ